MRWNIFWSRDCLIAKRDFFHTSKELDGVDEDEYDDDDDDDDDE